MLTKLLRALPMLRVVVRSWVGLQKPSLCSEDNRFKYTRGQHNVRSQRIPRSGVANKPRSFSVPSLPPANRQLSYYKTSLVSLFYLMLPYVPLDPPSRFDGGFLALAYRGSAVGCCFMTVQQHFASRQLPYIGSPPCRH